MRTKQKNDRLFTCLLLLALLREAYDVTPSSQIKRAKLWAASWLLLGRQAVVGRRAN